MHRERTRPTSPGSVMLQDRTWPVGAPKPGMGLTLTAVKTKLNELPIPIGANQRTQPLLGARAAKVAYRLALILSDATGSRPTRITPGKTGEQTAHLLASRFKAWQCIS